VERAIWDLAAKLLRDHTARPGVRRSRGESSPLIGKLFDENGDGLTLTHAVKGDRRYRCYVSRGLIKGAPVQAHDGWRLPAAEIERSVAIAAMSILEDQTTISSAIEEATIEANRIASILNTAARWGERLRSAQHDVLVTLIDRVELRPDGMRVSLKLPLSSPAEGI
jgi:site-specific DNA recombinase